MSDWADEKEALLKEFDAWLTAWSNETPRPLALIQQMLDVKPYLQMANEAEFVELRAWWQEVKEGVRN
ncbi:MAG: hypothetical protein R3E31_30450 [Chloroflexota bacterium]